MKKLTYTVAIALALFSGAVSTYGLTKFAPGAEFVIAVMGLLFEAGKLTAFALLHYRLPLALKGALVAVGLVLMGLNIAGVSGFLSNNYERQVIAAHAVNTTAEVEAGANVATLERRLAAAETRLDKANEALGKARGDRDQIRAQNAVIDATKKERDGIAAQLTAAQSHKAHAQGSTIAAAGEFATIAYVGELFTADKDRVILYAFLLVGALGDVLAVLLILAAGLLPAKVKAQPIAAPVVEDVVIVESTPEATEPLKVVEEVPAKTAPTPAQIRGRKAAMTRKLKALVAEKQEEIRVRKSVATRKRNARARAKARANGPKLVAK